MRPAYSMARRCVRWEHGGRVVKPLACAWRSRLRLLALCKLNPTTGAGGLNLSQLG